MNLLKEPLSAAPYALFAAAPWVSTGGYLSYNNRYVGIGTLIPSVALHIDEPNARLRLHSVLSDTWTVTEYATDNRVWHTGVGGSNVFNDLKGKYYIWDDTAGAVRLAIDGGGRVGIGTTNPGATMDVEGAADTAVFGGSDSSTGVFGHSTSGQGVLGSTYGGFGVYGSSTTGTGYAGYFDGKVQVNGNLTVTGNLVKGGGGFRIDHPLDPANQYLYHSFVESPDMKDLYDGIVKLDANGAATVTLPDWFEALNRDFRYQLTAIGAPGPNLYIAEEIHDNRFKIGGGQAGSKVSWQVTGIRHDPWAEQHRIPVEEQKPASERGKYLHPTEYGYPETLGIDYDKRQALQQPALDR